MQIHDPAAFPADKMAMECGVVIKTVNAIPHPDAGDPAKIGKQVQIPVHGSQADMGKCALDILVYDVGRRMISAGHKKIHDGFPLTAIFCDRHVLFLSVKSVIIPVFIIGEKHGFVKCFINILELYCFYFIK